MIGQVEKATIAILKASQGPPKSELLQADDMALLRMPIAELDFDSLDKLEFVMKLEDAFKVTLDEGDIEACKTLSDIARLVERAK